SINRVHDGCVSPHRSRFLALQLADEVPDQLQVTSFVCLGLRFLVAILAEVTHAQLEQFTNERCRVKLRNDDCGELGGMPTCHPRGIADVGANHVEPTGKRGRARIGHFKKSGISSESSSSSNAGSA